MATLALRRVRKAFGTVEFVQGIVQVETPGLGQSERVTVRLLFRARAARLPAPLRLGGAPS